MNQGVDSKALLTTLIMKIPILLVVAVTGAIVGSGLNLIIATNQEKDAKYVARTEYYIEFEPERYDACDYYNAYTWNEVVGYDTVLGRAMEILGDGYDKAQIRSELSANVYSDVRYLTITVKGDSKEYASTVSDAIGQALVEFGDSMGEFVRIYKVNEDEVALETVPHFTLRAALLGAGIFAIVALFAISIKFCIGSGFYTKRDISNTLGIPVYGISFKSGKYEGGKDIPNEKYNEMFYYDNENKDNLIAIVPFERHYREKLMDEIDNITVSGKNVTGAILTEADDLWYRIYRK